MTALRGRFGWADLPLWSHREEERRQLLKPNRWRVLPRPRRAPSSARQRGANQHARTENSSKCQQCLATDKKTRQLEGGETAVRESAGEGGNCQEDGGAEKRRRPSECHRDVTAHRRLRPRSIRWTTKRASSIQESSLPHGTTCVAAASSAAASKQRHSSRGSADKPNKRLFCCWCPLLLLGPPVSLTSTSPPMSVIPRVKNHCALTHSEEYCPSHRL